MYLTGSSLREGRICDLQNFWETDTVPPLPRPRPSQYSVPFQPDSRTQVNKLFRSDGKTKVAECFGETGTFEGPFDNGIRNKDLAKKFGIPTSTVYTILKNRERVWTRVAQKFQICPRSQGTH